MPDNMQQSSAPIQSAPAPSAPAQSNTSSLDPNGVNSPDDIFAEFEKQIGLSSDQKMNDFSQARKYEDKTIGELYDRFNNKDQNPEEQPENEPEQTPDTDPLTPTEGEGDELGEAPFKPYTFKGQLGNKEKEVTFETQEQLNNAIRKALVADKIYKDLNTHKAKVKEYEEGHNFALRFDELVEKEPFKLIESILEDMDENKLSEWLIEKANFLSRPKAERDIERRLKEAEYTKQQMAAMMREREEMEAKRRQYAEEADQHVVRSWGEGVLSKASSKFPEHYDIFKKELHNTLLEGRYRRDNGEEITIKKLEAIFYNNMKPLMNFINKKPDAKAVQKEIGRAVESKKIDGLNKVRSAAAMPVKPQTKRPSDEDIDFGSMFDHLIDNVGRGQLRMRK